jgi:hypothetical protein
MTLTGRISGIVAVLATALFACAGTVLADDNGTGGAAYGSDPSGQVGSTQLHSKSNAMLGSALTFGGTADPGEALDIQRLDRKADDWVTVATATADSQGNFTATWTTDHSGVFTIRSIPAGNPQVRASSAPASLQVTVFKRARATWFGPGFYGHKTACGEKMTRKLVGVASRTLPCGTMVSFLYNGTTVTVPVVDRGPYGHASWDLTYATAQELGFTYTDTVGSAVLPRTQ